MNQSDTEIKKVFLSATYKDLVSHRKAAIETIQRFGWFTVTMENFVSQDDRPKELCLNLVKKSDLYVGIFAHMYGYIPEGDNQSITEQEYRCACENGIKRLIFLVDEDYPWRKKWIDKDKNEQSLFTLKDEFKANHTCSFFTTEDNLSALISASLAKYTREELMKQLLEWSQRVQLRPDDQIPRVKLRIYRHPHFPTDVRCLIVNESSFPTSVRTSLDVKIDGQEYKHPVPGHYSGQETWDLPAKEGYEGHFDLETSILKPAGFSYSGLRRFPKNLEITIEYKALTQTGKWHSLGCLRYRYDFQQEKWQIMV
ncbi:DUF4062 domain-containing protein [Candidatus Poribacteria bacterium]|nr:DUF4062 domain-containing protein [Candidatus Poribacteria bacterium]